MVGGEREVEAHVKFLTLRGNRLNLYRLLCCDACSLSTPGEVGVRSYDSSCTDLAPLRRREFQSLSWKTLVF
jgi:hypothetical protein